MYKRAVAGKLQSKGQRGLRAVTYADRARYATVVVPLQDLDAVPGSAPVPLVPAMVFNLPDPVLQVRESGGNLAEELKAYSV